MSHFTRIQTKLRDRERLKQALSDLEYNYEEGQVEVRGYMGAGRTADLVAHTDSEYDIGFRQEEEVYECVADWWGIERYAGIKQQEFLDRLTQRYAYHKTVQELEEQGLYIAEEQVSEEDVIEMTVKWY